nr:hypothetical protein [Lacticaseibacillus rhamnosus]
MTNRYLQHLDERLQACEAIFRRSINDLERDYDDGVLDITKPQWKDIVTLVQAIIYADRHTILEAEKSIRVDGDVSGSLSRLLWIGEAFATLDFSLTRSIEQEEFSNASN